MTKNWTLSKQRFTGRYRQSHLFNSINTGTGTVGTGTVGTGTVGTGTVGTGTFYIAATIMDFIKNLKREKRVPIMTS